MPHGYGSPLAGYAVGPSGRTVPYASWWARFGAQLLDGSIAMAVILIPLVAGLILAFKDAQTDSHGNITGGVSAVGVPILVVSALFSFGFDLWNRGIRMGSKRQSFGRQIVGISTVRGDSGAFLGGGAGFLRWLMAVVFNSISRLGLLDVLWPLSDDTSQALHDKVVGSVVLKK
ncbi:MAG: RDD family protein [Aeromicrobium sp.]